MLAAKLLRAFLTLLILVMFSACSTSEPVMYQALTGIGESESTPTPVKLVYLSPTPPPATVTPEVTPTMTPYDDPDYYYGGMVVTLDDVGRTINLKKRQNFLLSLGKNYIWKVTVEPGTVISTNINITPEPGDQGIYVARNSGKAILRAVGEPQCRYQQVSCAHPNVLFQIEVQVE